MWDIYLDVYVQPVASVVTLFAVLSLWQLCILYCCLPLYPGRCSEWQSHHMTTYKRENGFNSTTLAKNKSVFPTNISDGIITFRLKMTEITENERDLGYTWSLRLVRRPLHWVHSVSCLISCLHTPPPHWEELQPSAPPARHRHTFIYIFIHRGCVCMSVCVCVCVFVPQVQALFPVVDWQSWLRGLWRDCGCCCQLQL